MLLLALHHDGVHSAGKFEIVCQLSSQQLAEYALGMAHKQLTSLRTEQSTLRRQIRNLLSKTSDDQEADGREDEV